MNKCMRLIPYTTTNQRRHWVMQLCVPFKRQYNTYWHRALLNSFERMVLDRQWDSSCPRAVAKTQCWRPKELCASVCTF